MTDQTVEQGDRPTRLFEPGRWVAIGAVAVAVLAAFAIGWASTKDWSNDQADQDLIELPPLVAPVASTPDEARVRSDADVIGVTVDGRHRAYVVATLTPIREHVVNDLVGNTPLTVTYCDRTDCVRAFTADDRSTPLDLAVGGWVRANGRSGMLLRSGRHRYLQATGQPFDEKGPQFPYREVQVKRTTWAKWRAAHPDTDVYVGGAAAVQ